jgi:hypothetical protein
LRVEGDERKEEERNGWRKERTGGTGRNMERKLSNAETKRQPKKEEGNELPATW